VKAIILAGGKGTRGRPFTEFFPKAMIPIEGKPLIWHIVEYLFSFNFIKEIIIISDFDGLGGQIKNYFSGSKFQKNLKFIQDSGSGTAGDLLHLSSSLKATEFLLWFVDNLCALDIKKMYKFFKVKKSLACIATRSRRKEETGFALVKNGIIHEFREKPEQKLAMSECLGMYILSNKILNLIKKKRKKKDLNLSFDILENLSGTGKISAYDLGNQAWLDVESPTSLDRNKNLVKSIIKSMER